MNLTKSQYAMMLVASTLKSSQRLERRKKNQTTFDGLVALKLITPDGELTSEGVRMAKQIAIYEQQESRRINREVQNDAQQLNYFKGINPRHRRQQS